MSSPRSAEPCNGLRAPTRQDVDGLDPRIGHFLYMKYVLMDLVRPATNTERLTFDWRRNSAQEPVLDAAGNPVLDARGNSRNFSRI